MTNEQINIAIAEACGWKGHPFCTDMMGNPFSGWDTPPDYCNCLNAMHQAEKIFNHAQYCRYISELCTLTIADNNSMYLATAAQRAEAFLKTIGKWEEQN